jgi:type I restriction enzyme S subunit
LTSRINSYLRPLVNKGPKNTLLITDEGALAGKVVFPKTDEQKKIADFISCLSNLILLHEKQLLLLKHSKQALLEQMFVNN